TIRENQSRGATRPGSAAGVILLPGNGPQRPTELLSCRLGRFGGRKGGRRPSPKAGGGVNGPARVRGVAWGCLVAVALLVGLAGDGLAAHDGLRRSVPAAGAVLDVAPREIRLTFTRAVDPTLARIELVDPSGRAVEL